MLIGSDGFSGTSISNPKEGKSMKKLIVAITLILVLSIVKGASADPQSGTYYPSIESWTTWQTYWNDGEGGNPDVYGDGPLEVGNVIMCYQSPLPGYLFFLCPNTQVGTVDPSTDLIITSVNPDPPATGTVEVSYQGGELELNGALWGESSDNIYMVDLDGATATAELDLTDPNGPMVTMEISSTGHFVDYPIVGVRFTATFADNAADSMSGFSGTPTTVKIEISSTVGTEAASWGAVKQMYR